jgi:transcriptional regulator with XRE-family HTH domain
MIEYSEKEFGNALKEIRELRKYSYGQLAYKCGLSASYLSNLEKGKRKPPKLENVEKIAQGLNINPEYFKYYREELHRQLEKDDPDFERKVHTLYRTLAPKEEMEKAESDSVSKRD